MYTIIPLREQQIQISPETEAAVFRVERDLIRLDEKFKFGMFSQSLKAALKRIEAVSAVGIGGKRAPLAPLLWAEALADIGKARGNAGYLQSLSELHGQRISSEEAVAIYETLCFENALEWLADALESNASITTETVRTIHQLCKTGAATSCCEGFSTNARRGGFGTYRPPAPQVVPGLVQDVCDFVNKSLYGPITQASIMHFQFEGILPFDDMSDRVGLALSHAILLKRGVVGKRLFVPFSWAGYVSREQRKRFQSPYLEPSFLEDPNVNAAINRWSVYNARNTQVSVRLVNVFLDSMTKLEREWRGLLGKVTQQSALDSLVELFLGMPLLTASRAAAIIGKSFSATNDALARLETEGIIVKHDVNLKERVFVAESSFNLTCNLFEQLMSKRGNVKPAKA